MTSAGTSAAPDAERKTFLRLMLAAWLAACVISAVIHWQAITSFDMSDPDDHLRLVQVRDLLAGQSWFDVTQHRFNPPFGGDMHWSRIVDLPLAAGMLLLAPLVGTELAETITLAVVPLLLLGITMAAIGAATRPLLGTFGAVLTTLLVMLIPSLVRQLGPMRIDHHGWQVMMAALCLAALVLGRGRRSGVALGVAAAVWVHVSAEALPYLAAIGALLGIRYLLSEEERPRFLGYLLTLAGASLTLFVLTRPTSVWLVPQCDALSSPFLLAFVAAALLAAGGAMLPIGRTLGGRAAILGVAGAGAGACLVGTGLGCAGGPFGSLDPVVYNFWYLNVAEGLPIWRQMASTAVGTLWSPVIGAIGTWLAWRGASDRDSQRRWAAVGLMLLAATGVALLVHRAEAVAHLYALPGCGFLLLHLLARVRALGSPLARVPLTAGVMLLPWPAPAMVGMIALTDETEAWAPQPQAAGEGATMSCTSREGMAVLGTLPQARILAPMDIGPAVIAATGHSVIAAGYHRNDEAMRDVITAFRGTPAAALAYVQRREIGLVAYCPGLPEVERYVVEAPKGFMAQLERNQLPDWLEPVPVGNSSALRIYRVKPSA